MEASTIFAAQILSVLVFVVFLGLGARIVWRNYFSRNLEASFPNLMESCFDCSCPRGWITPVRRALRELSRLQKSQMPSLQVIQIKEKFGGLRIYYGVELDHHSPTIDSTITRAEKACHCRCQVCGKLGKHCVLNGWHATLCEKCKQDAFLLLL